MDVQGWMLDRLEAVADHDSVLVRDPLQLISSSDTALHDFAKNNGFTAITAATNLVFRELYEKAKADPDTKKILVIDRAPLGRRKAHSATKAPPPFYPDFFTKTKPEARIDLDLCEFLKEVTLDPNWPAETNDPRYARLIVRHLLAVLRAHKNLRAANAVRFSDDDFKNIVAHAALGIADAAFKKLEAKDYWKIGLLGHESLKELDSLAPAVTRPIKEQLSTASVPFSWFATYDAENVIRGFYLAVILSQHIDNWQPLFANVDAVLKTFSDIKTDVIRELAPKLLSPNPQTLADIERTEDSLGKDALKYLLFDQLQIGTTDGFGSVVMKERYSPLFRFLALVMALADTLSSKPDWKLHGQISKVLFLDKKAKGEDFTEVKASLAWSRLKEAYRLSLNIQSLRDKLAHFIKEAGVRKTSDLSFKMFRDVWCTQKASRLEYYLSALERIIHTADLLPRAEAEMPDQIIEAFSQVRSRIRALNDDVVKNLNACNLRFQEFVKDRYPRWTKGDNEVCLTSQFVQRCLKKHWNPHIERAVVFVFDGMRYDIWDELAWPAFASRMDLIEDFPGSSLLPSETHFTRKAISAGAFPAEFDARRGEDELLRGALVKEMHYPEEVKVQTPEGSGTGEAVRYRAGNLDVYIFELCDKELHKVQIKTLPDGRQVPTRPLVFIYDQYVKDVIANEVMAIVRTLPPGAKVFVVADHGFTRVGRGRLNIDPQDLNEDTDCNYLNCWLRTPLAKSKLPDKVINNVVAFTPFDLRMPAKESGAKPGASAKQYETILFPKIGYSFSRPAAPYNPNAYSHGGISMDEMIIPMVALKIKSPEEDILTVGPIRGPAEVLEGKTFELKIAIVRRADSKAMNQQEIRVDVDAYYGREEERFSLPRQVVFAGSSETTVMHQFVPDAQKATPDERRKGSMEWTVVLTVSYEQAGKPVRKTLAQNFTVKLNAEQVVRRVGNLGTILGLTPKSMRGK